MTRRWAPALVLLGLVAGCEGTTAGQGAPEALPSRSTPAGLPVPDDPTTTTPPPTTPETTPPTTLPRTTPAGRPCPADVAATLPAGSAATLVAGFGTARFRLYFCRAAGGGLYYRGISRADAAQATTLPARTVPGGYEARTVVDGRRYVYRVVQRRLVVTRDGRQILAEPVTRDL